MSQLGWVTFGLAGRKPEYEYVPPKSPEWAATRWACEVALCPVCGRSSERVTAPGRRVCFCCLHLMQYHGLTVDRLDRQSCPNDGCGGCPCPGECESGLARIDRALAIERLDARTAAP